MIYLNDPLLMLYVLLKTIIKNQMYIFEVRSEGKTKVTLYNKVPYVIIS